MCSASGRLLGSRHDRPAAAGRRADAGVGRGRDMTSRPELCRAVAELIPGARFEVMEEEAHQPFQEVPDQWNARVDAFWREVAARG
jgi:pimeloyl-ACP methyl ester carboxylesterase